MFPALCRRLSVFLLILSSTYAGLTNLTIDDTDTTHWTFVGSWNVITPATPCPLCVAQPDANLAHNSTWHDGGTRSGSFSFQGTAVYIYGIDIHNPANVSFQLSDSSINGFHFYSGSDPYVYNSLFFEATNLDASVPHSITWLMEANSIGGGESALFDYARVTVDQDDLGSKSSGSSIASATSSATNISSSPAPSQSETPSSVATAHQKAIGRTMVGAVVGALGGIALFAVAVGCILLRRRRCAKLNNTEEGISPEILEPFQLPRDGSTPPTKLKADLLVSSPGSTTTAQTPSPASVSPSEGSGTTGHPALEERLRSLEQFAATFPPAYS
ncbi:hypothetical protein FB45DRAFT_1041839 [Roridomyces roridus]|uniref:Mid2 domain-containing protein n=1 Tax=Roridomyces roridus TaxID=1738132 RepID=A0AAD7AZT9_9AGAR|nr:hypothetical protein FB45DRAFT_1041839 [Roridomyces roridus]